MKVNKRAIELACDVLNTEAANLISRTFAALKSAQQDTKRHDFWVNVADKFTADATILADTADWLEAEFNSRERRNADRRA